MNSATLQQPVEIRGRALFSGGQSLLRVKPAADGQGLSFTTRGIRIPASPALLASAANCTVLAAAGREIRVVEHLLCALWAAGIDTAEIELENDNGELPNVDGSALPFYESLKAGGRIEAGPRPCLVLDEVVRLGDANASFVLEPADRWTIAYSFSHSELGQQEFEWAVDRAAAGTELLPARTFATLREIEAMQAAGLMRNDDETAGLLIRDGVPAQPLRFANEYARHKVLDMLGDLYLLPFDWPCKVTAYRTGHAMNHRLSQLLMERS